MTTPCSNSTMLPTSPAAAGSPVNSDGSPLSISTDSTAPSPTWRPPSNKKRKADDLLYSDSSDSDSPDSDSDDEGNSKEKYKKLRLATAMMLSQWTPGADAANASLFPHVASVNAASILP